MVSRVHKWVCDSKVTRYGAKEILDYDARSPRSPNSSKISKYLVRESARLVASAIEKRTINVFEAYEDATQAAVMARTAKEIDEDASKLSEDLGVDFFEYLSYKNTVLQELRSTLQQQTGF